MAAFSKSESAVFFSQPIARSARLLSRALLWFFFRLRGSRARGGRRCPFHRDKENAMVATPETASQGIRSLIPARIDRLPWSRFHTRLVVALGVAWVLDGLEITIASNVGPTLTQSSTLHMSASAVADIATWYLIGEVFGALFFGHLSDRLGRKKLFLVTLAVYLIGSGLTALTPAG